MLTLAKVYSKRQNDFGVSTQTELKWLNKSEKINLEGKKEFNTLPAKLE